MTSRPRPSHLGVVHVFQLVVVEGAVLGILVATRGGVLAAVLAALAGLLVVAAALTRRRGRWLAEWTLLAARARRRRRYVPHPAEPDPRLAALRCLAPRLAVQDVEGSSGGLVGVGYDGEGWFATATVAPPADLNGDLSPTIPLGALAAVLDPHPQAGLDDPGQSRAAVQVVTLTTPAPNGDAHGATNSAADGAAPADRSYRELLAATGPAFADRIVWVTVRLEARMLAEDGAGDRDETVRVPPALLRMTRRLVKTLRTAGLPVQVLDADGLLDALARCCDLLPPTDARPGIRQGATGTPPTAHSPRGPVAPEEDRRVWRSSTLEHVTYWLQDWPRPTSRPTLLDDLAAAPAGLTSVAVRLVAEPDDLRAPADGPVPGRREPSAGDRFDVRALVRIGAPVDRLGGACQAMTQAAEAAGARLFRLDGEQAPAVYATAPTGGGRR